MPIRSATDLGRLVKAERLRRGLTQAQLATLHGTTQRWISLVESGKDATRLGAALRLLGTLGVVLDARPAAMPGARPARVESGLDAIVAAHASKARTAPGAATRTKTARPSPRNRRG